MDENNTFSETKFEKAVPLSTEQLKEIASNFGEIGEKAIYKLIAKELPPITKEELTKIHKDFIYGTNEKSDLNNSSE